MPSHPQMGTLESDDQPVRSVAHEDEEVMSEVDWRRLRSADLSLSSMVLERERRLPLPPLVSMEGLCLPLLLLLVGMVDCGGEGGVVKGVLCCLLPATCYILIAAFIKNRRAIRLWSCIVQRSCGTKEVNVKLHAGNCLRMSSRFSFSK